MSIRGVGAIFSGATRAGSRDRSWGMEAENCASFWDEPRSTKLIILKGKKCSIKKKTGTKFGFCDKITEKIECFCAPLQNLVFLLVCTEGAKKFVTYAYNTSKIAMQNSGRGAKRRVIVP